MKILLLLLVPCIAFSQRYEKSPIDSMPQYITWNLPPTMGFMYCKGIRWTETKKQDSVLNIEIEGDTMTAIRNLLVFCMQEKEEKDGAEMLLRSLNLDYLKTFLNDKTFDYLLKDYRKVVSKNKKARDKAFPEYKQ